MWHDDGFIQGKVSCWYIFGAGGAANLLDSGGGSGNILWGLDAGGGTGILGSMVSS